MANPKGGNPLPPPPNLSKSSKSSSSSSKKKTPPKAGQPGGKDYYTTYLNMLQGLGIHINQNVIDFARHAASARWNSGEFMYFLRQQDFYAKAFVGKPSWMSEAQYNSLYHGSYTQVARQAGVEFDKQRFGYLLSHNVSAKEFADRAAAIQRVKENPIVYKQFQDVLQHRGMIKGPLKLKELWDAAMGTAPAEWYHAAEQAYLQSSAAEAGLRIGSDITRKELHRLAISLPGFQGESDLSKNFVQMAQQMKQLKQIAPEVGLKVPNKLLYQLEFGGPRQQEAAARVSNILSTYQGLFQPEATGTLQQTGSGGRVQTGFESYSG